MPPQALSTRFDDAVAAVGPTHWADQAYDHGGRGAQGRAVYEHIMRAPEDKRGAVYSGLEAAGWPRMGQAPYPEPEPEPEPSFDSQVIRLLDSDGDGVVSEAELRAAIASGKLSDVLGSPEPEPEPELRPAAQAAAVSQQRPASTAASPRIDAVSAQLDALADASAGQAALEELALLALIKALAATAEQATLSTSGAFDPSTVESPTHAAVEHIEAVKSQGRHQLAKMSANVSQHGGSDDRLRSGFLSYESAMENRWQSEESALAQQWISQQQDTETQKGTSKAQHVDKQHSTWASFFHRSDIRRFFVHWRKWVHTRRELATEGDQTLQDLLGSAKQAGGREAESGEVTILAREIAKKRLQTAKLRQEKDKQKASATMLKRTVAELQAELIAATNATVAVQENARRMHKRHAAERHAAYEEMQQFAQQANAEEAGRMTAIHVGGLDGELANEVSKPSTRYVPPGPPLACLTSTTENSKRQHFR